MIVEEENQQLEPYILVIGDILEALQAFLVTDKQIITEVPFKDVPLILLAAYFGYNTYLLPKGMHQFLYVYGSEAPQDPATEGFHNCAQSFNKPKCT